MLTYASIHTYTGSGTTFPVFSLKMKLKDSQNGSGRQDTLSPAHSHLYTLTCTLSPVHSHLHNLTCTLSSAHSHLYNLTCTLSPAHSHLHTLTCIHSPMSRRPKTMQSSKELLFIIANKDRVFRECCHQSETRSICLRRGAYATAATV